MLADGALLVFVLGAKELKGHHAQLVVGEAEDKAQDEIGRVGGEDAVVNGYIHPTPLLVVPADGGVAILHDQVSVPGSQVSRLTSTESIG